MKELLFMPLLAALLGDGSRSRSLRPCLVETLKKPDVETAARRSGALDKAEIYMTRTSRPREARGGFGCLASRRRGVQPAAARDARCPPKGWVPRFEDILIPSAPPRMRPGRLGSDRRIESLGCHAEARP